MPAYPPIGVVPGLVSGWVNTDILIGTFGVALTVSKILIRHTDYDDSGASDTSVIGSVRDATGGGGSGIAFTIVDQTESITVTQNLAVAAGASLYLRVTTAAGDNMNIGGWVELSASAGVTTALTNLGRVKAFLGITATTDDALINQLIANVSDELQGNILPQIIEATATDEKVDSIGDHRLTLRHAPIISITALEEAGSVLVLDTSFELEAQDKERGQVIRISGTNAAPWATGRRIVKTTYQHGYATVPGAIEQFATELVSFDFRQSQPGGGRFGLRGKVLDTGGSSDYLERADIFKAGASRLAKYQRAWL